MNDLNEKISIWLGDEKFDFETRETLGIDRDNLDEEIAKQASTCSWFLVQRAKAAAMIADVEAEIKDMEAVLDPKIRAKAKEDGEKITEAGIKAAMQRDEQRGSLKEKFRKLMAAEGLLGAFVDAFRQRKDMLVSLGFSRRQEMSFSSEQIEQIKKNLEGGS